MKSWPLRVWAHNLANTPFSLVGLRAFVHLRSLFFYPRRQCLVGSRLGQAARRAPCSRSRAGAPACPAPRLLGRRPAHAACGHCGPMKARCLALPHRPRSLRRHAGCRVEAGLPSRFRRRRRWRWPPCPRRGAGRRPRRRWRWPMPPPPTTSSVPPRPPVVRATCGRVAAPTGKTSKPGRIATVATPSISAPPRPKAPRRERASNTERSAAVCMWLPLRRRRRACSNSGEVRAPAGSQLSASLA